MAKPARSTPRIRLAPILCLLEPPVHGLLPWGVYGSLYDMACQFKSELLRLHSITLIPDSGILSLMKSAPTNMNQCNLVISIPLKFRSKMESDIRKIFTGHF